MASFPQQSQKTKPQVDAKYPLVAESLAARIRSGALEAGERLPTFVELQAQFSVTPHTVNRAMIALEHQGLVERRRGSGVYVAPFAAASKTARNRVIGLAGFGFRFISQSSYWAELLNGIQQTADEGGQQILLLDGNPPNLWEKADGIIICDWSNKDILQFIPSQLPCVSLFHDLQNIASVGIDECGAARQATQHLLDLGHRRIAYLSGGDTTVAARRLAGFKKTMKAAGLKTPSSMHRKIGELEGYDIHFTEAAYRAMQQWLKEDWSILGCTALICHNDAIAIGASSTLREEGVLLPGDVSVIGFDGLEICNHVTPRLTTIEIPLREIGAKAVEMLSQQIAADEVSIQHRVLPSQLRERESTCAPRHS